MTKHRKPLAELEREVRNSERIIYGYKHAIEDLKASVEKNIASLSQRANRIIELEVELQAQKDLVAQHQASNEFLMNVARDYWETACEIKRRYDRLFKARVSNVGETS